MQQEDIIRDIRKRCRMAMNGVASASMRQHGLEYKLNFGLSIQQLKDLAKRYEPSVELAEALWRENTRELKILATLLYPAESFTESEAADWVSEIPNQEIREQICANLLQVLSFANQIAQAWVCSSDIEIRITGYWLLARLFIAKKNEAISVDKLPFIWTDIISENIFLRKASLLALKHIGRQSKDIADNILQKVSVYKNEENLIKREAFDSIAFEFDYFFED